MIDGSTDANQSLYEELEKQHPQVTFLKLVQRPNGHGPSYTMNVGAHHSSGRYLCFLDDDDHWTDDNYLEHVAGNISRAKRRVDVHYSNQRAIYANGVMHTQDIWLSDLIPGVAHRQKNSDDCYHVDTEFLLSSSGFAHLNCSIFERNFYKALDGMDEGIRYENDRDIFIRSIDAASVMLFSTRYNSLHSIPNANANKNVSTVTSMIQKKLYQLRVYDKGISLCKQERVVRFCCRAKTYELKHLAAIMAKNNRYRSAAHYARIALISGFNFRWLAYTLYLTVQSWLEPQNASDDHIQ